MKDVLQEADARIDRVLRGIGGAEPAEDMERRVLLAVHARGAERRKPRRSSLLAVGGSRWGFATAGAACLVALVLWAGHQRAMLHGPLAPVARVMQRTTPASASQPETSKRVIAAVSPAHVRRRRSVAQVTGSLLVDRPATMAALTNHPAPEAPLTDEERLLLRIASRRRPEEFVALDPAVSDARLVAEQAEFQGFFEPPKVNEKEKSE